MQLLRKSDFEDSAMYDGLNSMDCLLLVAEKAWEKENYHLPERFKQRIRVMGGTDVKFVYHRDRLTATDFDNVAKRFNMPRLRCAARAVEELDAIGFDVKVDVIQPNDELTVKQVNFTYWPTPSWYVLNQASWVDFVRSSGNLRVGDSVQVWKFRLPHERTGFAFVKL